MPKFPSEPWLRAVIQAVERHPELPLALDGLGHDLAAVVEAEHPALEKDFAVYGRQQGGRIAEWRVLEDEDEILELEPAYVLRAPYFTWRSVIQGEDPIKAALAGRIQVQGDLQSLIRKAQYRHILEGALASIKTEY